MKSTATMEMEATNNPFWENFESKRLSLFLHLAVMKFIVLLECRKFTCLQPNGKSTFVNGSDDEANVKLSTGRDTYEENDMDFTRI